MKKTSAIILVVLLAAAAVFFFAQKEKMPEAADSEKLKIVTTLFPLYDMARAIGGEKAEVTLLLPPGVEPHAFEPTPGDIARVNSADVFIYTGKFMEPWAEDIVKGANAGIRAYDASTGITLTSGVFHDADEPTGSPDPHIWLDLGNAEVMAVGIGRTFVEADPANAAFYKENTDRYTAELKTLDEEYKSGLSDCATRDIVYGGHYAFGYLAKRYGLNYYAAQGIAPDAEPTAQDMAELVRQIKKENIKYVFYEELTTPRIAETLSAETSAKLLMLNAAHNVSKEDVEKGAVFFDILRSNLENLRTGLSCN